MSVVLRCMQHPTDERGAAVFYEPEAIGLHIASDHDNQADIRVVQVAE